MRSPTHTVKQLWINHLVVSMSKRIILFPLRCQYVKQASNLIPDMHSEGYPQKTREGMTTCSPRLVVGLSEAADVSAAEMCVSSTRLSYMNTLSLEGKPFKSLSMWRMPAA